MPFSVAQAQGASRPVLPPGGAAAPGEIVLKMPDGTAQSQVEALVAGAGCEIVRPIPFSPDFYLVRVKGTTRSQRGRAVTFEKPSAQVDAAVATLMQSPGVIANPNWYAVPRGLPARRQQTPPTTAPARIVPNDPLYATRQTWHMDMIRMPEAWAIQSAVRPVVIAVTDTGIDASHPDFQTHDGQGSRLLPGVDVSQVPILNDARDIEGHGTHVAGTAGATTNNTLGVTGVAGYNGGGVDVKILPIKIFPDFFATTDGTIAGVNYATQQRADVHNMSWGGYGLNPALEVSIARGVKAGVIMVAAAGNDRYGGNFFSFPDQFPGVIRVTAVGPNRTLASYSNFGPMTAIAAPGGDPTTPPFIGTPDDVWSTWPLAGGNIDLFAGQPLNTTGYQGISGTSMASPHVAGVVALMLAAGARPEEIRGGIQRTAQRLDEEPNFAGGNKYGAGLIDAYAALLPFVDPDPQGFLIGSLDLGSTYKRSLKITLQIKGTGKLDGTVEKDSQIVVEIRRATGSIETTPVTRAFVGGVDFTVPKPTPGQPRQTVFTITLPQPGQPEIILEPGRYNITARITYQGRVTTTSTQFITIATRAQPTGRSLFAVPFRIRQASATPENAILGNAGSFKLVSFDALQSVYRPAWDFGYTDAAFTHVRNSANDGDQNGFGALANNGAPLTWEVSNPSVSIAPVGIGFWLDRDSTEPLDVPSGAEEVINTVAIRLYGENANGSGWNLIGTPFTSPVDWNTVTVILANGTNPMRLDEAVAQNIVKPTLVGWQGDYIYQVAPMGRMEPFNGYWVRALQDCTLLVSPGQISSAATRATAAATTRATSAVPVVTDGWRARFSATVGGDRDGQNYFGQTRGAETGEDRFDITKPPSGGGHAYVRFLSTDASGRSAAYAYDMRPSGGGSAGKQEWTVAVTTDKSDAKVTLSWDGLGSAPRRSRFTLTDSATGTRVPLRSRSSYTFRSGEAGTTRLFKISMDTMASAGPLAITNVNIVSGKSVQGIAVKFTTNQEAEVTGSITTLTGKLLGALHGATRAAASSETTLRWDGRSQAGGALPIGGYLVEITARSADGQVTTMKRPIQLTR